ncbi:phosphatase PAP2 family protein [Xenorhabdus nematophila]|uniref:Lipid A 1-diphosphate synthase n=1 Tax=Xenorhabdus nematophila (strain ATCC 19061 / DSM 3370 / CCUG 14189 / LMG 1036 / NCIMB 9965 / AN6) TaxID=406817 RepID=D3VKU6_XENNA|nr:phosphatase PAP2 family protein [Xenorhabdus nematophila]CEE90437.1 putative phosphatase [Xenorhabdus nematophila str. Anatoliense]AYA39765.1 phosphatase PAP2 family protein [Xenorhabdus nematophila]MBA0018332.1 phosphatase PAP2 family protein [Xenorhabdus nematophila]MCB4424922.1 phosphatase PAP2 family protein [Xenorhabdus nematophila]QNJ37411.1 phosphatase PAP2 family protein [Xenorhabdus nematophila]
MTRSRPLAIIVLNILGIALFFSWYLPENHGFWFYIDSSIFYFFNEKLLPNSKFALFVAIVNVRAFDIISLLCMGLLYYSAFRKQDYTGKRRLFMMGVVMLISAVIINQIGHQIPVSRPSPTLTFENVNRVGEMTSWHTKDASKDSFPGDHGLMLLIFSSFILRYVSRRAFFIAILIMITFALPRIMAGAHWFTDIAVGSLSLTLVGMSWVLLTPLSDIMAAWLDKKLPHIRRTH